MDPLASGGFGCGMIGLYNPFVFFSGVYVNVSLRETCAPLTQQTKPQDVLFFVVKFPSQI